MRIARREILWRGAAAALGVAVAARRGMAADRPTVTVYKSPG